MKALPKLVRDAEFVMLRSQQTTDPSTGQKTTRLTAIATKKAKSGKVETYSSHTDPFPSAAQEATINEQLDVMLSRLTLDLFPGYKLTGDV